MSKPGRQSDKTKFVGKKVLWIEQAKHFPLFFKKTQELLDERSGFRLNSSELDIEASVILGFLLQETSYFEGMNDKETERVLYRFIETYLDIRDEEWYPGISYKEIAQEANAILNGHIQPKLEPEIT